MKRDNFLKLSATALLGTTVMPEIWSKSIQDPKQFSELEKHKIDKCELLEVNFNWPRFVGKNGRIDDHGQYKKATVLQLKTQQGAMGWGMSEKISQDGLDSIIGKSLNELITVDAGLHPDLPKAFDFALHDLMGVVLEKPVYELLGNKGNRENPVYSGMIYLDELNADNPSKSIDRVLDNCKWDVDYGYRQLKVKIGRSGRWYSHDKGLEKDIEVTRAIYDAFKDQEVQLLVDANDMYGLEDTKMFLQAIRDIPLFWFEEPFTENREESLNLRNWMNENGFSDTLYADGEFKPDHDQCMALAKEGILNVYLNDIYGHGFTNWRGLMPELKEMDTWASPHAWGSLLKTHYTAHLAAGLGNIVTIEGVTCFSDEIDFGDYKIKNGKLITSNAPGFGMKLLV